VPVEEGRLVESRCPTCGAIERRAFGEFVSRRGELASYAFGWTSGHAEAVGKLTIGIGVGNPGGATFHMRTFLDGDGAVAFALVDEPFEDVPQGGPDITAEEARADVDLPFIWHVAREVLDNDGRGRWMVLSFLRVPVFATPPVAADEEPVRSVVRDGEGEWALLCGTVPPETAATGALTLTDAIDRDPTLREVLDLERSERADRDDVDAPWEWTRRPRGLRRLFRR
jgi:hypothetical protein